jgi:hypothetical protein
MTLLQDTFLNDFDQDASWIVQKRRILFIVYTIFWLQLRMIDDEYEN